MNESAHGVACHHERTRHAEEVASDEEDQHQCTAKMHPCQDGGEILWRDRWAEEAVENHDYTYGKERNAQNGSRMAPFQKSPDDRHKQKVEWRRFEIIVVGVVLEAAVRPSRIGYSCRHLIRPDSSHVHLSFDLSSIGQPDMQQQKPIAAHVEIDIRPIAARS